MGYTDAKNYLLFNLKSTFNWVSSIFVCHNWQACRGGTEAPERAGFENKTSGRTQSCFWTVVVLPRSYFSHT